MKIAYVNASMKVGQDGVSRCVYRMIDAARDRGHEVVALTSALPDETLDIPMYDMPSVPIPLQKGYRLGLPSVQAVARRLDSFAPDIIHVNSPCTVGYTAMRYARKRGIPVVGTYHTHFPTYPRYYGMEGLEEVAWSLTRRFYNHLDTTFVPTRPILDELAAHHVERLRYVPNGVDTDTFNPAHRSEAWRRQFGEADKPIALFVSRLVWEKDLRILFEAWQLLTRRHGDMHLVIVGDGPARAELEAMMPNAHFLGYRSGKELSTAFASSDIFVFPSTTETFGLVTLEAMASGLAPVAARAGGAVELIQDGITGLFAEPLNSLDLANNIECLLDRPRLRQRIGESAFEYADSYRWDRVLLQIFDTYVDVIHAAEKMARHRHSVRNSPLRRAVRFFTPLTSPREA